MHVLVTVYSCLYIPACARSRAWPYLRMRAVMHVPEHPCMLARMDLCMCVFMHVRICASVYASMYPIVHVVIRVCLRLPAGVCTIYVQLQH